MLTCSNCGATVREGAKFCTSCGTRLNDAAVSSATNTWAPPSAHETEQAQSGTVADEPSVDATSTWETSTLGTNDSDLPTDDTAAETAEAAIESDRGFSWSWGGAETTDDTSTTDTTDETDQVDEESGIVLQEAESVEAEPDTIVDATEVEILEEDPTTSEADDVVDSQGQTDGQPDDAESSMVVEDAAPESDEETETLAAWAEQWNVAPDEDNGDEAVTDILREPADDDDEDVVAKAERLIDELKAIVPSLARPKLPEAPAAGDSSAVADDLEGAARIGQFDDVRDALLASRDNPRDVDNMLNLAGKVDRLLELLDDRNNLAKTAEHAASRLRNTQPTSSEL